MNYSEYGPQFFCYECKGETYDSPCWGDKDELDNNFIPTPECEKGCYTETQQGHKDDEPVDIIERGCIGKHKDNECYRDEKGVSLAVQLHYKQGAQRKE